MQLKTSSNEDGTPRRPHDPPKADPVLEFDLARELRQLNNEPERDSGQNARTLVKFGDLRVIFIALKRGSAMPGHHAKGSTSIHVVAGHIIVRADGRTFNLHDGGLLALDQNVLHDVTAVHDSAFLLTVAWPGEAGT